MYKNYSALYLKMSLFSILFLVGLTIGIQNSISIFADNNSVMYQRTSSPFGISFDDWVIRWWQWNIAMPTPDHPNTSYTPEKCSRGQEENSSVWFLTLPFGEEETADRTCSIPTGKSVMTALLSGECDYSNPRIVTDDSMKQCAIEGDDFGAIQVSLDGVDLNYNMSANRVLSPYFNISLPKNNFFSEPAGVFRAVVDGYFLFLKPLSPGEHELKYKVSVLNPSKIEYNYFQDVTYHLVVG